MSVHRLGLLQRSSGALADLPCSHGIAIDPVSKLVDADSAGRALLVAFDPGTFAPVRSAPVLDDADGVTYDPFSRQIFVSGDDGDRDYAAGKPRRPSALHL